MDLISIYPSIKYKSSNPINDQISFMKVKVDKQLSFNLNAPFNNCTYSPTMKSAQNQQFKINPTSGLSKSKINFNVKLLVIDQRLL